MTLLTYRAVFWDGSTYYIAANSDHIAIAAAEVEAVRRGVSIRQIVCTGVSGLTGRKNYSRAREVMPAQQ